MEGARPDKVNQDEPEPIPVSPEAPDWLSPEVGEVFAYTVAQLEAMGIAFAADRDALVAYCEAVALHQRVSHELIGEPLTVLGAQGNRVKNPLLQVQRDAAQTMRAFAQQFGLTPSARASVKAEKGAQGEEDNPFASSG